MLFQSAETCCNLLLALSACRVAEALAEENALSATLQLAEHYDELMLAHRKEVYCTIVTAQVRQTAQAVPVVLRQQGINSCSSGLIPVCWQ